MTVDHAFLHLLSGEDRKWFLAQDASTQSLVMEHYTKPTCEFRSVSRSALGLTGSPYTDLARAVHDKQGRKSAAKEAIKTVRGS
ncbi:hypothetical protein Q3V23_02300 [Streptomyces sp. VNUA116]|uniref:hypothetical protein n=1 Tax=Streptomyces sp. VNUA116 TaxID=3062449 RepID=UPI0026771242|nr:hypothetical protein [Streptomyces sp. VNUA116]WKU42993.1 hypothetical protein Q3V23_02300 [Streptomyces sp. VNUA116]